MTKTANLYVRIEPNLKAQAEQILNAIGLPPSSAYTCFISRSLCKEDYPLMLNYRKPLVFDALSKA